MDGHNESCKETQATDCRVLSREYGVWVLGCLVGNEGMDPLYIILCARPYYDPFPNSKWIRAKKREGTFQPKTAHLESAEKSDSSGSKPLFLTASGNRPCNTWLPGAKIVGVLTKGAGWDNLCEGRLFWLAIAAA